jgi:hypothetical protein
MPDVPLQPFTPPAIVLDTLHLSGLVSSPLIFFLTLGAVALLWLIYTLVAVYHWVKYADHVLVALPVVAVHLYVSYWLFVYIL